MSANPPPTYMSPYLEGDYRARVHVIQKALESAYRNGKYDPDVARALDEDKYWAYKNRKTHQLITINWNPDFCDFQIMTRIVSKKWMHQWSYVWEFVNEKGEFSHPHVHLLIKKVKPLSQVVREIAYTAGVDNNYVDVKEIPTRDLHNVRKYMTKNRPYDVEIRAEYLLHNMYSYLREHEFPSYDGEMEEEPLWSGETKIY